MSKKKTTVEKIDEKYGHPVNFSDFRRKSSFTKNRNSEIEKAIDNDCYGAFRIACALDGLTWNKICDLRSIDYLLRENASKIVGKLIEVGKEDKTTIDVWSILCRVLEKKGANFENVVRGFAAYPFLEHNEKVEMLKAAMFRTQFVREAFEDCGTVNLIRIRDFFEELFPGENLFPARFGNWTDTRDGEIYKTIRLRDTEWLCAPLKYGMGPDGLISLDEFKKNRNTILPDGWRLPTEDDVGCLENERLVPGDADDTSIFCPEGIAHCALVAKDSFWPITEDDMTDEDFAEYGSEEWNRQIGMTGTDFRPTYGTGDSRESTVMTILCTGINGNRGVGRLAFSLYNHGFEEPECVNKPWRYDAKVYERCCLLLCRDSKN